MSSSRTTDQPISADISAEIQAIREALVEKGFRLVRFLAFPALLLLVIRIIQFGWNPFYLLYVALLAPPLISHWSHYKLNYHIRVMYFLIVFFIVGVIGILSLGLVGVGVHILLFVTILVTLLYGNRAGLISCGIASVLILAVGYAVSIELITYPIDINEFATSFVAWLSITVVFFFWAPLVISAYGVIYGHFINALKQSRTSEEQYKLFLENSMEGVWMYTCDPPMPTTISFEEQVEWIHQHAYLDKCNDTYAKMYGYSSAGEISGKRIVDVFGGNEQTARYMIRLFIEGDYAFNMTETYEIHHGTTESWHVSSAYSSFDNGLFLRVIGFVIDITDKKNTELEREELESQLRQAQKMEAIGTLAGGIAHDFNNILTVILGNLEYWSLMQQDKGIETDDTIIDSLKAAHRAKDLVNQILTFSRKTDADKLPLDIGPICKETLKLLRSSAPATIDIIQNIQGNLPRVVADPTHIHQIIMNLCTNAVHAMKDQSGTITVTLDTCLAPSSLSADSVQLGDYCLCLEISDTGTGIPDEVLKKIFLPYYTTKPQGEGTGLGLAVVHGIVKDLGGDITVKSTVGEGTTFSITLPALDHSGARESIQKQDFVSGTGRILIVDDELQILHVLERVLRKLGYESVVAYDGDTALAILRNEADRIDMVITDYTMPKQTGIELVDEFRRIKKDIPVILITGLQTPLVESKALKAGIDAIIRKPPSIGNIAEVVKQHMPLK